MHAPHTYIYVTHLTFCGRNVKHTILKVQYNKNRNTNSREQADLWKLRDNSMSFTPFLPKPSPNTLHTLYFQEYNSLLPKGCDNNMIFLFQKCDTFDRTTKGRPWQASQDHPDYTRLIWASTIKIHIIDSKH